MQHFVDEHRALILRHSRAHVKAVGEKIAPEDVAREIELMVTQLADTTALTAADIVAPDAYVRSLVKHATGRARRRRTLIEQLAAGDDLAALSRDLAALDADLPPPPAPPSDGAIAARAALEGVKDALSPADALVFALLVEDDGTVEDVAAAVATTTQEVSAALERALAVAAARGLQGVERDERRGDRA